MKQALLVFLGGGLGSMLRYLISKPLNALNDSFYLGTFAVNILGCLLIGLVMGLASKNQLLSQQGVLFFATGICGGFTTFSAFAFEKHSFLKDGAFLPFLVIMFQYYNRGNGRSNRSMACAFFQLVIKSLFFVNFC